MYFGDTEEAAGSSQLDAGRQNCFSFRRCLDTLVERRYIGIYVSVDGDPVLKTY